MKQCKYICYNKFLHTEVNNIYLAVMSIMSLFTCEEITEICILSLWNMPIFLLKVMFIFW